MKTNELTGAALDWAVGIANGWITYPNDSIEQGQYFHTNPAIAPLGHQHNRVLVENYTPSTNWAQGGPIIEREQINIGTVGISTWRAGLTNEDGKSFWADGPTPLIAAMRCFVASKLGDEVELPTGL